jgi:hypothetical protein|tara:strand:+ start:4109 stop:4513 length:405 start_codon:yes stop_codon:yes gene_type:complete
MQLQKGLREGTFADFSKHLRAILGETVPVVDSAVALDDQVLCQLAGKAPELFPSTGPQLPGTFSDRGTGLSVYQAAQVLALAIALQGESAGKEWFVRKQKWLGGDSPVKALATGSETAEALMVRLIQSAEGYVF